MTSKNYPLLSLLLLNMPYVTSERYCSQILVQNGILNRDHHDPEKVGIDGCRVRTVHLLRFVAVGSQELLLEEIFGCIRVFVGPGIVCRQKCSD